MHIEALSTVLFPFQLTYQNQIWMHLLAENMRVNGVVNDFPVHLRYRFTSELIPERDPMCAVSAPRALMPSITWSPTFLRTWARCKQAGASLTPATVGLNLTMWGCYPVGLRKAAGSTEVPAQTWNSSKKGTQQKLLDDLSSNSKLSECDRHVVCVILVSNSLSWNVWRADSCTWLNKHF